MNDTKHPINGIIANALEALARQVRESDNDVTQLGSIGVGEIEITDIEYLGYKQKKLYGVLTLDHTPPPPPPVQNAPLADDDDTDDGVKLPSQLLYDGISRIIKGGKHD